MAIFANLKKAFGSDPTIPRDVLSRIGSDLYKLNAQAAISEAQKWQPVSTWYSFRDEMTARYSYLQGSMQSDMRDILKRRFPKRYAEIEQEQVNIKLFRRLVLNKAKVFLNPGRFFLRDENGEELEQDDPSSLALAEMMRLGQFGTALKEVDLYTQGMERCMWVNWWDRRRGCVRVSLWQQHQVHMVPDPDRYWDLDDCPAVLLELPSRDGLTSANVRYQVWGKAGGNGKPWQSFHYVTGSTGNAEEQKWYETEIKGNEEKRIPYVDEKTGEPVYPFVLWQNDINSSLYCSSNEDALTINRMVNSSLTDTQWALHFQAWPVGYIHKTTDQPASPPALTTFSPADIFFSDGYEPAFASPDLDPNKMTDFCKLLAELEAKIDGNSAQAVMLEQGGPESGYALKIRNVPLATHIANQVEIYRPQLLQSMERAKMVWNTYCEEVGEDPIEGTVDWEPGEMEVPMDEEADSRVHGLRIAANVETAVDWRMALTGEDAETAEQSVRENAEKNKELAKAGRVQPEFPPTFGGRFPQKKELPPGKEEDEEEKPEEDEEIPVDEKEEKK